MDDPKTFTVVLRVTLAIIMGLLLPQALGFLGYRWARRRKKIFKAATLLIAPLLFLLSANVFWRLQAKAIQEAGYYLCGAFGAAAVFSTIYGTLIHMVLGAIMFLVMTFLWKRQDRLLEQGKL
ncbi:MAG: hypothetical protein P8X67_02340 [Syntrophobacterales bacterium]|jgi:hypothetical protein